MMAQRCQEAQVIGVDLDAEACDEARENVAASPFADRVSIACCRLQDYESAEKFDAIVSNPPFFLNSLKIQTVKGRWPAMLTACRLGIFS